MQGHIYSSNVGGVAVSVAQDFFEILAPAGVPFLLHSVRLSQDSDFADAQAELLRVTIIRVNVTVTSGSGGTTTTERPHSPASPGSSMTSVEANNTTEATSSTTLDTIVEDAFNVQAGWLYLPTPEERILFAPSTACVIGIPIAPTDSLDMTGTVTWEEFK